MTKLKLKDNTFTSKDEFDEVSLVTKKVVDKTLHQLEKEGIFIFPKLIKDAKDITKDQIVLQNINDCYRTSNVMGFLGYGKERLVIESRFSTGDHDYFFQYLLERVLDFPNVLELSTDANQDTKLFNLLLFLFPYYLNLAMRKGIFKTYIRNQYNDSNVKGTIDVARHISMNTPFTGNIAYNQREFSYDNYLMELIRHTIEFIKIKPHANNLLRKVKDSVSTVVESTNNYEYYDRMKIIVENTKNPIRHAYYHEYRALQQLCIMILQHEKHQLGSGVQQIHGILFDGAWLWEEYINSLIDNIFHHPMNRGREGAQWLFAGNVGLIYPDFISRDTDYRMIADAKYKPIGNIGNKDYLQVLAYMFRFDAKKGFFLFPESSKGNNIELKMNSGSKYEDNVSTRDDISVIKYGLRIPINANNYEEFKKLIAHSEKELKINFKASYKSDLREKIRRKYKEAPRSYD